MVDKMWTRVVRPGGIDVFPFPSGPAPETMMAVAKNERITRV
jgi:hypothetical protein